MKKNSRQRLATMAIITLTGVYCPVAMAESDDFSVLTLEPPGFNRGVGKEVGDFSLSTNVDYATGKYVNGPWTFKLAVPYIRITDRGSIASASRTELGLGDVLRRAYTVYKSKGADPLVIPW